MLLCERGYFCWGCSVCYAWLRGVCAIKSQAYLRDRVFGKENKMFRYSDYPESESILSREEREAQIKRARNGFLLVIGILFTVAFITGIF